MRDYRPMIRLVLTIVTCGVVSNGYAQDGVALFEQAKTVLQDNCVKCHGGAKTKGGLRMTSAASFKAGGDSGAVVNAKDPSKNLLLKMVNWTDEEHQMPPKEKLSPDKIEVLTKWVKAGAPYPDGVAIAYVPAEGETLEAPKNEVNDETRKYWAFQKPVRHPLPACKDQAWAKQPIDYFIKAKLEGENLTPAPEATRQQWIRRAYYDLIGLPPTVAEVKAFESDTSVNAHEKVINTLLGRPQYGEKWGRHWLDLVRFAESNGYERDGVKGLAWKYRDYVINSFNKDKPYDQFLIEQLAGDEVPEANLETVTATGYYRLGIWDDEPADRQLALFDGFDDIIKTTSEATMGITMACARCHDHKIDPLPQRDYYKMLAFFRNVRPMRRGREHGVITEIKAADYNEKAAEKAKKESAMARELDGIKKEILAAWNTKNSSASVAASPISNLTYRFYRSTWDAIPDFDMLKNEDEGKLPGNRISLSPATRPDAMGFVFRGKILVPKDGTYRFFLDSKDGSRLLINNTEVVRFDGLNHPEGTGRSGRVELAAGLADIRIDFFNKLGEPRLNVRWSGPGVGLQTLSEIKGKAEPAPSENYRIILGNAEIGSAPKWRYTTKAPTGNAWQAPGFAAAAWKQGAAGFGTRGTPGARIGTEWKTKDLWMRTSFQVGQLPKAPRWRVHHDEDLTIYLNGKKVFTKSGYTTRYVDVPFSAQAKQALRKGKNVIAVHCKQTVGGQYVDVGIAAGRKGTGSKTGPKLNENQIITQMGAALVGKEKYQRYQKVKGNLERSKKASVPGSIPVMAVQEAGNAATHILRRGNPSLAGRVVTPGFPSILGFPDPEIKKPSHVASSGRRLAFAQWLASTENPLTARVMVNRIWQHHFGRGIVVTPSDFGNLGAKPTHPKLLDWLATEFMAKGWSMKAMHKTLMLSSTYRMSVAGRKDALVQDPGNDNFWRFNPRRLTAEEVRDSVIGVTGQLNLKMGGPSMYSNLPEAVLKTASKNKWGKSPLSEQNRRAVYILTRRSLLDPVLTDFDKADTDNPCPVRFSSILPTQALGLLNSPFANDKAALFAERIRQEKPGDLQAQLAHGFSLAFSRTATPEDLKGANAFIDDMMKKEGLSEKDALDRFALLLLNLNEFVFVD